MQKKWMSVVLATLCTIHAHAVEFEDYRPTELCADLAKDLSSKKFDRFDRHFNHQDYQQLVLDQVQDNPLIDDYFKQPRFLFPLADRFIRISRQVLQAQDIKTWSGGMVPRQQGADALVCALMSRDIEDGYVVMGLQLEQQEGQVFIRDWYDFQNDQLLSVNISAYLEYMTQVMRRSGAKRMLETVSTHETSEDLKRLENFFRPIRDGESTRQVYQAYQQLSLSDQYHPLILKRYIEYMLDEPEWLAQASKRYVTVAKPTGLLLIQTSLGNRDFHNYHQGIDQLQQRIGSSAALLMLHRLDPDQPTKAQAQHWLRLFEQHGHEQNAIEMLLTQALLQKQDQRVVLLLKYMYKYFGSSLKNLDEVTDPELLRFMKTKHYQEYVRFIESQPAM